jgi:hypothetical protein
LARLSGFDQVKSDLKRSEASSIEENTSEQESRNLFGSASITTSPPQRPTDSMRGMRQPTTVASIEAPDSLLRHWPST